MIFPFRFLLSIYFKLKLVLCKEVGWENKEMRTISSRGDEVKGVKGHYFSIVNALFFR